MPGRRRPLHTSTRTRIGVNGVIAAGSPVRGCLFVALTLGLGFSVSTTSQERQKEVLVLYAVRRDAQMAVVGDRELPQSLQAGLAEGVDYYSEFLDVARLSQNAYEAAIREFLELKYHEHRFDALIAIGDVPLQFLAKHRDTLFGNIPVVFFSTQPAPVRIPNSTGVVAELNLVGTLDLITRLQPDIRALFVVSGTAGSATEQAARMQFAPFESRVPTTYLTGLSSAELESRLATLPGRSAVYYLVVDRDKDNQNLHPLQYLDHLVALTNAPVYSWVDSAMDHGIVGGSLKDQARQARVIGELAIRVLRGEPADSIPLIRPDLNVPQVDWRQLHRWSISEARLPPGTVVAFREPSIWDRYGVYIVGTLSLIVAETALIAALFVQRRQRHHAEAQVQTGEEALRASYERIRDLGGRLLRAQDSERARLARELHDDVSQQLALLEIDLEQLGSSPDNSALTGEALDRARSIARSVHDLSHRLHPAKLRLIGLVAALKGLQREVSQAGIPVTFTHDDVPAALPPELTLCLFRVAQEALQNALKHSGADNVAVHLGATSEDVTLSITDNGTGFDVRTSAARGLGLLSMKERVEAAGGLVELSSSGETGTRVAVSVPNLHSSPGPAGLS